jgi:hypothetical protein
VTIVALLAVLALAGCGDQPGTIRGTVIRSQDGKPAVQAEVVVFVLNKLEGPSKLDVFTKGDMIQTMSTGEDGAFSFSLEPGDYVVEVWLEGVEAASSRLQVRAGQTTAADFHVDNPSP